MKSNKDGVITAVQCEPIMDPALFDDLFMSGSAWDSIVIKGNDRDFTPAIGEKVSSLFDLVENFITYYPESLTDIDVYVGYCDLTTDKLTAVVNACRNYKIGVDSDYNLTAALLTILTGEKYDWTTIRGYCQRDWNILYYPADLDSDIRSIECVYFGMLSEYVIDGEFCVTVLDCDDTNETLKEYGVSRIDYINGYTTVPTYTTIEI